MIFISAGHHLKDPGAVGSGTTEARETMIFRDLVCRELDQLGARYIKDNDAETLAQYLYRIKPGNASVVVEYHFNAASNPAIGGVETIVENEADRLDLAFAKELTNSIAGLTGLVNRGVKPESMTARKTLGLMREEGIIALVELCFISNPGDMAKYRAQMVPLARAQAQIIKRYEDLIK